MAELIPINRIVNPAGLGNEWRPWEIWHPPAVLIQVFNPDWMDRPVTGFAFEFAAFRAALRLSVARADLYWRLTGIGKQQIEGLDR